MPGISKPATETVSFRGTHREGTGAHDGWLTGVQAGLGGSGEGNCAGAGGTSGRGGSGSEGTGRGGKIGSSCNSGGGGAGTAGRASSAPTPVKFRIANASASAFSGFETRSTNRYWLIVILTDPYVTTGNS